eukprot:484897-Hanusia_phi.AAC.2
MMTVLTRLTVGRIRLRRTDSLAVRLAPGRAQAPREPGPLTPTLSGTRDSDPARAAVRSLNPVFSALEVPICLAVPLSLPGAARLPGPGLGDHHDSGLCTRLPGP